MAEKGKEKAKAGKKAEKAKEKRAEKKPAAKAEKPKAEAQKEDAKEKTAAKKKEKPAKPKARGIGKSVSKEVKLLRKKILLKRLPLFRGRFGERGKTRKISKEKWMKWRKPRGLDIKRKKEDGAYPKTGYKAPKEIRFLHPSGFREAIVSNASQLSIIGKDSAAKIAGTVGDKKRREIVKKAKELGVRLLN